MEVLLKYKLLCQFLTKVVILLVCVCVCVTPLRAWVHIRPQKGLKALNKGHKALNKLFSQNKTQPRCLCCNSCDNLDFHVWRYCGARDLFDRWRAIRMIFITRLRSPFLIYSEAREWRHYSDKTQTNKPELRTIFLNHFLKLCVGNVPRA